MIGAIRTRDILAHPVVTIQCFGWRLFFRALFLSQHQTFLLMLQSDDCFRASIPKAPEILDQCIGLELQAMEIYTKLAQSFPEDSPNRAFLNALADQERQHAELLELCRAATIRGRWNDPVFRPWAEYVPRLEQQLKEARLSLESDDDPNSWLRIVTQIESSEVNQLLLGVIEATDSEFVRSLGPFRSCVKHHINFICQWLSQRGHDAILASRELHAKCFRSMHGGPGHDSSQSGGIMQRTV